MIQIVLVDDHPALRLGLMGVLRAEPGLVPLEAVASSDELWPVLNRARPQVVILDYHLPGEDGLAICRRVKRLLPAPAVLLYSAYATADLAVAAVVAGADGVLHKGLPADEIYDAVREVARGGKMLPTVSHALQRDAIERIDLADAPVLTMRLDGATPGEIAEALRCSPEQVGEAIDRILHALRLDVPAPS